MIDEILNESPKRHYDEAFSDDEEDDLQYGGGAIQPVHALRNWNHVPNKQRCATPTDNLWKELTQALRRTIERHIDEDLTLTPESTVHFTLQSRAFTHAFEFTTFTFTVREFRKRQ